MLEINREPIGVGRERACYVHPDDPRLAIKIPIGNVDTQTRREIRFYRKLGKRGNIDCKHIPAFHGQCDTNLGKGTVVELVRNYDGEISRPMNWYLDQGMPIEEFEHCLAELRQSFLENLIIFNHDMTIGNLLVKKTSLVQFHLVAIDGLGDVVAFGGFDIFPFLVRRKIRRRWQRFITRVYHSREVLKQREASAGTDTER